MTLEDGTRCHLAQSGLPYAFWLMALLFWIYNYNRTLRPDGRCPYEMRFGKLPNHDKLQWFGQQVFLKVEPEELRKFDPRGIQAVLMGYGHLQS